MLMFQSEKKRKKEKIALLRLAWPWELTFLTSLVTSVVNSGSKLDAWVTSVNGYRADFSSTRKPDSADLTYSTTCSFPPLSSFLSSPFLCSPPYSIVLCVQSQDKSVVQERWKPESCLIMSHFQAVIKFSLPYSHTCTTTQRYMLSTQDHTTQWPLHFKVKFYIYRRISVSYLCSCHFPPYCAIFFFKSLEMLYFWSHQWAKTLTKFNDFKRSVLQGACSRE